MGLSDGKVGATIAVSDMDRAIEFYEGKLGLAATEGEDPDGGRTYECGGGTALHVYPSPFAQASGATAAGWTVEDAEGTIADLLANGVALEVYSGGDFATDEKGIFRQGEFVGAWVKDPDGNVLAIGNM
jgi:catechol 2,3-dioxygenase-like lactoylglutathione lyase family enzyme